MKRNAMTMIELLIVVAVMVILMGIALPVMRTGIDGRRLAAAAETVVNQVRLAQAEAVDAQTPNDLAAARQEVGEGLAHLRVGGLLLGVAIGFFTLGGMVLVLFTVSAVSAVTGLPLWVTALIVLLGVVVLGGLFAWLGYRRLQRARVIPEQTLAAAKEDLEWAQQWTKRS